MATTQERVHEAIDNGISGSYLDAGSMKPEHNMVDDLGADSLDLIEALMAVEEEFDIQIDDDRWEQCKTIGDVYECVEETLQKESK